MKILIFGLLAFVSVINEAMGVTPPYSPYSRVGNLRLSTRVNSRSGTPLPEESPQGTPRGTPRSQRRSIPPIVTRRLPATPPLSRRSISAPVLGISLRGIPLPPTLEACTQNPRIEENWMNRMYQFHLENSDATNSVKNLADANGSIKFDVVCGMNDRTLTYAIGEANNYDMAHRIKLIRNALSDILDQDPRRYKPGRVEIVQVNDFEEEACAVRVSPYRLKTIDEAFDDLFSRSINRGLA